MTKLKKAVSIVLCFAMLLSTLTVGFMFAFADTEANTTANTMKKYADLKTEYTSDFFYAGTEIYEGEDLTDHEVNSGETLRLKFYTKTDYALAKGVYFVIFAPTDYTKDATTLISTSGTTKPVVISANQGTPSTAKAIPRGAGFTTSTQNTDLVDGFTSGYTAAQVSNWFILRINDTSTTARTCTTDDKTLVEIDVTLSDTAAEIGSFNVFLLPCSFTASALNSSGRAVTAGFQTLAGSAVKKVAHFETSGMQTFNVSNSVTFNDAAGAQLSSNPYTKGDTIVPPTRTNSDFLCWKDSDGNFVDFSKIKMGSTSVTYTEVLKTETVNYTFNANGGTINSGTSYTLNDQKIDKPIELKDFIPTKGTETFSGWTIGDKLYKPDEVYTPTSVNDVTFTASWGGLKIMVSNIDTGWTEAMTYTGGVKDEKFTTADYNNIKTRLENSVYLNGDKTLKEIVGTTLDVTCTAFFYSKADGTKANIQGIYDSIVFGTTTTLYAYCSFTYTVNKYFPNFDADGVAIADSYTAYGTPITFSYSTFFNPDNTEENIAKDGKYVSGTGKAFDPNGSPLMLQLKKYDSVANKYVNTTGEETNGVKQLEYDEVKKYNYTSAYKDGNDKVITFSTDTATKNYNIKFSAFDENGVYNFYTVPVEKTYNVVAYIDGDASKRLVLTKQYKFGDTIVADDFKSMYLDGDATQTVVSADDLKQDGKPANKMGYKLKDIYFMDEATSALAAGASFTIDKTVVDNSYSDYLNAIIFNSTWEEQSYSFTLSYKNANGEWKELVTKEFKGSKNVTYGDLVNSDAQAIIDSDHPVGEVATINGFKIVGQEGFVSTVEAYKGPLNLRLNYSAENYYAYIDYNNGSTVKDTGYQIKPIAYGSVLYDPNFDAATGDANNAPYFNRFILSFMPTTYPVKKQKEDSDGNLVYKYLQVEVKDADGNVVLDTNGQPLMENAKDEKGNYIYDTTQPIYIDAKGDVFQRPYRNCEYVGTKVYHLDAKYVNYSDLPDQSEWIEGYGNDEYKLYGTTIIQVQWKNDNDFFLRVYDTENNLYSAFGKDFKMYYWNKNKPCTKSEAVLNTNAENQVVILFKITKEEANAEDGLAKNSWYLTPFYLGNDIFEPAFLPKLVPTIVSLLKKLLSK